MLATVTNLKWNGWRLQFHCYHLNRAIDEGLTREQAAEVIAHLAFYARWPSAFSALPGVKDVFEKRPK